MARWRLASPHLERGGFSLLEVVVALALLSVGLIAIGSVLTATVERVARAEDAACALEGAQSAAAAAHPALVYPVGWQPIGAAGPDGALATVDDVAAVSPTEELDCRAPRCWRRVELVQQGVLLWFRVEAACGPRASGISEPTGPGATAAHAVLLVAR